MCREQKGPGVVQRALLAVLDEQPTGALRGWLTITELTLEMYDDRATRANLESVRRACKSLAAAGMVELDYMDEMTTVREARVNAGDWSFPRCEHFGYRKQLLVHLLLSVEAREQRAQFYRDSLDRLAGLDRRIESP